MATEPKLRNTLNAKQFYALVKYIEGHKVEFQRDRPLMQEVAERATRDLGFEVRGTNIKRACGVSQVTWRPKRCDSGVIGGRLFTSRVLARALLDIGEALDLKLDPRVAMIANGRTIENGSAN